MLYRPPLEAQFFGTSLAFLQRLARQPETSVLRRALTSDILLLRAPAAAPSWATDMDLWARRIGTPIDWASLLPPPPRDRVQPGRLCRRDHQERQLVTLPSRRSGREQAIKLYASAIRGSRGQQRPLSPVDKLLSLRAEAVVASPSLGGSWDRRPSSCYLQVPTFAGRGLLARVRLGLPLKGFSVWTSDPARPHLSAHSPWFHDGLPPDHVRLPLPAAPTPCLGCPGPHAFEVPGLLKAPRFRDRTLTFQHACECRSLAFTTIRRRTLPGLVAPDCRLDQLLLVNPPGLLAFLQQVSSFYGKVRAKVRSATTQLQQPAL